MSSGEAIMPRKPITKLIDALSMRTRLGEVMKEAEKESTRFLVSRRGKPTVVILGVEDYLRSIVKKTSCWLRSSLGLKGPGWTKSPTRKSN
jgi:prevent-host-death family protein